MVRTVRGSGTGQGLRPLLRIVGSGAQLGDAGVVVAEHAHDGGRGGVPSCIELTPQETERVRDFRRLFALGGFSCGGRVEPPRPHNPEGALQRQAERVTRVLG